MSVPFIEKLREVTSEVITEIRNQDFMPQKPDEYWKL